jgi:oligopeptide/dipeptide ABC transporter ATP-binding protein
MREILTLRHIKKYYPVRQGIFKTALAKSLSDVNFTIYHGNTLSIVGESGSGKTTTTRLVLLLEKPTEGKILFKDQDILSYKKSKKKEYRKKVQAVFQDPYSSLDPRMKVGDIVAEPLQIHSSLGKKEIINKVDQALDHVGIDPLLKKRYPNEFSGGQLQRISIARALTVDPELLILDEPISALDVSIRGQILNIFHDLQREKDISFLFISHDIFSVRYLSDYIAIMYLGKIVEYGPSEVIFNRVLHPYTEALLDSCRILSLDKINQAHILKGEIPSILDLPRGCPFNSRCKYCMPVCGKIDPDELRMAEKDHFVACHKYNDYTI